VNGWAQGFVLPPGGGQLSVTRNNLARMASLFLELLATLAICLLALPGKRADPVEEAEALTALREARNGKRAASPTRRAVRVVRTRGGSPTRSAVRVVRTEGAGHRAVGGMDLFAFARKRSGQPRPDQEPVNQAPAGTEAAEGETAATAAVRDAELAVPAQPEAVTAARRTGWGQDSHGGRGNDDSSAGSPSAPWDMVGNWDSPSRTGPSKAWSADPLEPAKSPEGTVRRDDPFRLTGQQASLPISPVPEGRPPASPVLGTPVPEIRTPESRAPESREPETGSQRAPWESGPQAPVSATGIRPPYPWETGPQPASRARPQRASRTDEQPASRTGEQRAFRTGEQPVRWTGGQSASRTGEQPASRTGSPPASRTGSRPVSPAWEQPATPTGAQPVPTAPWESADWDNAPGWDAIAGSRDVPSAQPEPETGSGAWPATARPAKPEKPEKPERHSHRAAKHGRPSRWRGSGNRSARDKDS
jgi:hypothetical protein